ncbi:MAG: zinc-dependent alcohol dehydrogenase [Candidatus Dormibacteria bacterium]
MKAFRLHGLGAGRVDHVPDPVPTEVDCVVRPLVTGLCSSDIHIYRQAAMVDQAALPITMGHELMGEIVAVNRGGPALDAYSVEGNPRLDRGRRVIAEPLLPCGACPNCGRGQPNLCRRWTHLGISRDGCWADLVSVPASRLVAVADDLADRDAVLVEPLACAVNFIEKANLQPGMSVLVLGGGPAGLLTIQVARAAGASPLLLSEPNPHRRALGRRLGADFTLDPLAADFEAALAAATSGLGPDVVIEVTGVPAAVTQAIAVAAPGSTVVLAGICGGGAPAIDADLMVLKELVVRGAVASRWHFGRAMRLLASGRVTLSPMVSDTRPWQLVAGAMDDLASNPALCKILLGHDA